jgi:hypothetical protein
MNKYILDGHIPVRCDNLHIWALKFEDPNRQVRLDKRNDVIVSTVFLGTDHSFGNGPPLLFETMIFGGEHNEYQERCGTWEQAEAMHERACKMAWPEEKS